MPKCFEKQQKCLCSGFKWRAKYKFMPSCMTVDRDSVIGWEKTHGLPYLDIVNIQRKGY